MNARQIEVFRTIMRCGTLTAAAQALNVSQPALSQLLLHAEDQLGFRLFQRLHGRLTPTPEANLLFPEAERLHRDLEGFRRFAADLRHGKQGALRLAASAPTALSFVPQALADFRIACPGVRVVSYIVSMAVLTTMLDNGEADLGVALNDTPQPLIQTERIGRSEVLCLLPQGHRLAAQPSIGPADLEGETLISYRPDSLQGVMLAEAFAEAGTRYLPQVEIDVSIAAIGFVQQGLGVALVDALVPWSGFQDLTTRRFLPQQTLPISLLFSTRRPLSTTQNVLRRKLREAGSRYMPHLPS
ncbi:LysR family transcriptional regulator [Falsiroseomonas sp.]|uniref:LysR family transcriptional regulator n=1 Tax=Falsiroseomonas sp. TaxID=2870721 RepID=UPI003F7143E3